MAHSHVFPDADFSPLLEECQAPALARPRPVPPFRVTGYENGSYGVPCMAKRA